VIVAIAGEFTLFNFNALLVEFGLAGSSRVWLTWSKFLKA